MIAGPFLFMPNRTDYPDIATARVRDFTLPREKGSALPLLADAQSDAVGSKQVTAMGLSTHTSREGHKNLANAT